MNVSRRGFMKLAGIGAAGLTLSQMGLNLTPVSAHAAGLKIEGAQEVISVCPFCAVSCNFIAHVRNGKIVSTEGDPDYPVSEGALCAKGAAMLTMHNSDHRLQKPLYRAPYSTKWEEKDWDWMLNRIAQRVKETRDRDFIRTNAKGQEVNRVESIFHLGSSQMDNEECAIVHQGVRGLGLVHFDHQARVCHSSTVAALGESFGRGAMTNHWCDIENSDCILIMGSNAAEHHPISFKWVLRAKDKGATVMHVDPKFSRTSARSDFHVPIRSGSDIAFLGGMINYIVDNDLYFKEYVVKYTNAALIVGKDYKFSNGLFSGYDKKTRTYDKSKWAFEMDENGAPKRDESLKDSRCVFQLMKKHYSRYSLSKVSETTGVSKDDLLRVWKAFTATGKPDKAGTIMYALGWTQHTVGVQNIRTSAMLQLLLGNIGVAGGGINALRGEPNVQGSTDHSILWHILPGYMSVPKSRWQSYDEYLKANTPVSHTPDSANWWQNTPKYFTSLLKSWRGDKATAANGYGYSLVPKADDGEDYSYIFLFDRMYRGKVHGGFIFATNPAQSAPNGNKVRKAMDQLDWLVMGEINHTETTDNWHRPGVDATQMKTEVFLLPCAQRAEKEGSITNSGRWQLWHHKACEPMGQSRSMGAVYVDMLNHVRRLYTKENGTFPEPILSLDWPQSYDAEAVARRVNGFFTKDVTIKGKTYKKGQQVPSFVYLSDDGATASMNWLYCGGYTEEGGNLAKRRDLSQTPMQAKINLFPNYSWAWPVNRRILYNRASVDMNGKPYNPQKAVIAWQGGKWVGDVPDGGWPPMATGKGRNPFIMQKEGYGHLFGPGRQDGPFPEHYEPVETPIKRHPFSGQLSSPCYKVVHSDMDKLAEPADERFPIVLTTYSLTEHWCGGGETRNTPHLMEAEPQLYVEMSPELAKEKGIANGDPVVVESIRARVEAIAMVTVRMTPFKIRGNTVHQVGMPFCYGWTSRGAGDCTNRLTPSVGDPNTAIPEFKACLVNVHKAEKLTEIE
ncbi:MAG: formate dehydrogenase-N subunit alpha [Desulfovibrio sp.]|uniref:formate dehydrogenase-N subunit alpha n=1 Tax=Desulfovibrio sp. 7SRBS1 TaxID=3378064 RepID=UPI003B3E6E47